MYLSTYHHETLNYRNSIPIFTTYDSYKHIYFYILTNAVTNAMVTMLIHRTL